MYSLMVLLSAIFFTVGGVFMKLSQGLSEPIPSLLIYLFFIVGASLQTIALRKAALGVTYVIILGLESVLAFLFGVFLFQETYSISNFLGLSFIVAGISFLHADSDDSKTYANIPSFSQIVRSKAWFLSKSKVKSKKSKRKI